MGRHLSALAFPQASRSSRHVGPRADAAIPGDVRHSVASFGRHLRAGNLALRTIDTYTESARQLATFLVERGMPTELIAIRRGHVEAFTEHPLEVSKPATANNRFRGLQSFFRWAVEEGEITRMPMANMRPPKVPESPPAGLSDVPDALIDRMDLVGNWYPARSGHSPAW